MLRHLSSESFNKLLSKLFHDSLLSLNDLGSFNTDWITITGLHAVVTLRLIVMYYCFYSLRKHPFLLALRRWGHFTRKKTSATQRQKFHTDDVKSIRNLVRSADWSTQELHCFSYCLWMTDKRQKATKVKCKRKESLTKQSIFVEYSLL